MSLQRRHNWLIKSAFRHVISCVLQACLASSLQYQHSFTGSELLSRSQKVLPLSNLSCDVKARAMHKVEPEWAHGCTEYSILCQSGPPAYACVTIFVLFCTQVRQLVHVLHSGEGVATANAASLVASHGMPQVQLSLTVQ